MWTESTARKSRTVAVATGGVFWVGSLLPYLFVGPYWGMVWMYVVAPFSFLLEATLGIGNKSFLPIILTSLIAAIFWSAITYGLLRLIHRISK
jgi:hypothetical protein